MQCLRDGRACCPVVPKQLVICRFLRFHRRRSRCCFSWLLHWTGTCWCEFPTKWNLCKRVRARSGGAWTCLAHALECLRDRRACCPARTKQLVICRVLVVSAAPVTLLFQLVVTLEMVLDGLKFPLDETCTNKYAHVVVVREHVWRTLCSVCATGARVAQPFLSNS